MTQKLIAIDGVGGAGKTTVAHLLALRLNANLLPSGLLYRFLAWDITQKHSLKDALNHILNLKFKVSTTGVIAEYEGNDVYEHLMQNQIGTIASKHIAQDPLVREALLPIQREYASKESLVCEGRDMASVVFPECDVAVYLTATLKVRNLRRGMTAMNDEVTLAQRDQQDMSRKVAPLTIHPKSHIIDTSFASPEEVVDHIMALIQ